MNSSKFKENVCRICLQDKGNINWNNEIIEFGGVSYKDCYYNYTKLEENDPDSYPSSLCEKCGEELRNAHMLFEKAVESFKILQDFDIKYIDMFNSPPAIKVELQSNVVNVDDNVTQMEENPCFLPLYTNESCSNFENTSSESNGVEGNHVNAVDTTHFIDIHKFDSLVEIPFDERFGDSEVSKPLVTKSIRSKRKKDTILPAYLQEQNEVSDTSSFHTKARKRTKPKLNKKITGDCNENNDGKIKEVELNNDNSLEYATKSDKRSKEKNFLICSYCSLKVPGAKKLEAHEATHNKNRERKETCPECGLKFYTDRSLNLHVKIHDENRQKNHKCEFCEKAFFNKGGLNVHRRVHLGLMIKCQICEKDFFRQVDLDKHLLKHSVSPFGKNVGKKKNVAQCEYCNKFILTEKLKEHIAVHLNQPQVKCKICDKNFYSRDKCTRHLRRFHLKSSTEYEDFIHYYVDRNKRLSSLMVKQQLVAQAVK